MIILDKKKKNYGEIIEIILIESGNELVGQYKY